LGPAAYLVDLFHFLTTPALSPPQPIDVLFQRRPDLQYIKLSCENTNTAMPYVDIVNEILETFIALGGTQADPKTLGQATAKDTPPDATSEELSATPVNLNDAAYDTLRKAVFPFALPYDRPLDTVRSFLTKLGVTRLSMMQAVQHAGTPSDAAIAQEILGLSPAMAAVINGTSGATLEACYGVASGSLPGAMIPVLAFLSATGLSYLDLIALVGARFINPKQTITLDTPAGKDSCDLSNVTLKNLDVGTLGRMHRFLRLQRALGLTIADLDAVLTALAAADLTDSVLGEVAVAQTLRATLRIPLEQLLTFWAPISTWTPPGLPGPPSLYTRLFQNRAVFSPVDDVFALNAAGTDLNVTTSHLADHLAPVLAALQVGANDYACSPRGC
jgi:hypothetical protein